MPDFLPGPDGDFQDFFQTFSGWCVTNGASRGMSVAEVTALDDAYAEWNTQFSAHNVAQAAALSATQAKMTARAAAEPLIRAAAAKIQAHAATTDAERAAAGLTVRDTIRTRAAVPTTRPVAQVDTSQRLRHVIHFRDEATPQAKRKPEGVLGAEIRCFIGPNPPTDANQCEFVTLDTSTPHLIEYDGEDANKVAHYMLCWVNTRGEKGPWSETVSATIGA